MWHIIRFIMSELTLTIIMNLTSLKLVVAGICLAGLVISCGSDSDVRVIDIEKYHLRTQDSAKQDSIEKPIKGRNWQKRKSMRELRQSRKRKLEE